MARTIRLILSPRLLNRILISPKLRPIEHRSQLIHLIIDGLVHDSGVDLGRADLRVAEHFADCFERYAVGKRDGRGECVAGEVRGHALLDSA